MNNEEKELGTTTMDEDYIQTINDLKANTVSKEEYLKLKEDNKKLLNSLVNGERVNESPELKDISQMRNDLLYKNHTNMDYIKRALELREETLKQTGKDIFVSNSSITQPSREDYANAHEVAEAFQYCLDRAEGNESVFTSELQRIMVDPIIPKRKY